MADTRAEKQTMKTAFAFLLLISTASAADYPIIAVRSPRPADRAGRIPEVFTPIRTEPGTDLVRIDPDGTETVLVEAGDHGCVLDPQPSLDAKWVFYSYIPDARRGGDFTDSTVDGADIWKLNVETGEKTQLTFQEWTPNRGTINWSQQPKTLDPGTYWPKQEFLTHGVYNLGACPLPGNRLAFTSSRNGYYPQDASTHPLMQLYLMDDDGKNVEQTGFLNLAGALHPTLLKDGRIIWSSGETQGHREHIAWSLWVSKPDGRTWEPLVFSARGGGSPEAFHWQSQWSDGDIGVVEYYARNNSGFGRLLGFPVVPKTIGTAAFGHPKMSLNPKITPAEGDFMPFQRHGMYSPTPWTHPGDRPNTLGKVSMPSAAPNNEMLVCYSPGPAHHGGVAPQTPHIQSEIRVLKNKTSNGPEDLELVKGDPAYNYLQPKALVPWVEIYGSLPPEIPECPDSTHPLLPKGTPFGLVGTSTFYKRETYAANGQNWISQGSNATPNGEEFDSALIDKVRILIQEPTSQTRGNRHFVATGKERLRVLGDIPLRKPGVVDAAGDPDTSFLARIPADVSFTFQLLAQDGTALTTAQTWHQLRPAEIRHDCDGCHAHNNPGISFEGTAASKPEYLIADLTDNVPWTLEYNRDIKPVFTEKCLTCHSGQDEPNLSGNWRVGNGGITKESALAFGYSARTSTLYTKMKSGHGEATAAEALKVAQWIDLGGQWDTGNPNGKFIANGVLVDDHKPTLFLQSPRRKQGPVDALRFGAFDTSGLGAMSVKASFSVNGKPAGTELFSEFTNADSVYTLPLAVAYQGSGEITLSVKDSTGNETRIVRSFQTEDTGDDMEQLKKRIAELESQIKAIAAKVAAWEAWYKAGENN